MGGLTEGRVQVCSSRELNRFIRCPSNSVGSGCSSLGSGRMMGRLVLRLVAKIQWKNVFADNTFKKVFLLDRFHTVYQQI